MFRSNQTKGLFMRLILPLAALIAAAAPAMSQQRDTPFRVEPQIVITPGAQPSPYVGFETREVKTLSTDRQEGLKQGRGLGYALAAEMNGLPGPMHVLELADQLGLDAEQKQRTTTIYNKMRRDAVVAGEALIAAEAHLDRMFAQRNATPDRVEAQTSVAAAQEARLRAIHLNAHLAMMDVLKPEQVESYGRLRGYAGGAEPPGGQQGHGHQGSGHHGQGQPRRP
jgi:Spy/CpxP family protein refolding chaperone